MGIWVGEDRLDIYDIVDKRIQNNAECVAAVCLENSFVDKSRGYSMLKVNNYGKTFNLCDSEPFRHQPAVAGPTTTGFLVEKDVVATAAHFVRNYDVKSLRFIFGYRMEEPYARVDRFSHENIYKGVEIIGSKLQRGDKFLDWELVKLDRNVEEQTVVGDFARHQSLPLLLPRLQALPHWFSCCFRCLPQ